MYVSTRSDSQPCRDGVAFEFSVIRTVRLEEAPTGGTLRVESYLTAYSDLRSINDQAAMAATGDTRLRYLANAQAAQTAMIWASAKALGDEKLEELVTLDPSQGYRLVLNKQGIARIEQFQRSNKLPTTGQLDFATLDLIGKMTGPGSIKESGDRLLILPSEMFREKAVMESSNKSAGLVELSRAAKSGN